MKSFIARTALVLFALVAVTTSALAAGPYRYKSAGILKFRTHAAAIVGNEGSNGVAEYGVDGYGGFVDSAAAYVPNAADLLDTTEVFFWPNDMALAAASDSLAPIVLHFRNSVAGGSGDTLHAIVEPYFLGTAFVTSTAFPAVTNRVLTGAHTAAALVVFPANPAGAYAGSESAASTNPVTVQLVPTLKSARGFRVRTWGDGTAAFAGNGQVSIEVMYLTAAQ